MTHFEPSLASLRTHALPDWYDDAKFGIFIHWGLFSIPAFAPRVAHISDAFDEHYEAGVTMTPYTEWYWNAIRCSESPSAAFHREHYGEQPYANFRAPFDAGLERWDAKGWARLFRRAGARYVVLVSKHHDGYCLWPSRVENPRRDGWTSGRDVVGELADAVRGEGLRFGLYYSGGIDWSWNERPVRSFGQFIGSMPGAGYPAYAEAQVRELIERYSPSVLWNDIFWPTPLTPMLRLMADYYHAVPAGVLNDRWMHQNAGLRLMRLGPVQRVADALLARAARKRVARGEAPKGIVPPVPAHYDFRTPEYTRFDKTSKRKWEATRGMSASFGYNRNDGESDYESAEALLHGFIDGVSKNGNLLLNVGPRGEDAAIPEPQVARLLAIGDWLEANGEAIYGTRPWLRAEASGDDGTPVRFTQKGDRLYAISLGAASAGGLLLPGLEPGPETRVWRLSDGARVDWRGEAGGLRILPRVGGPEAPAHAFAITPQPAPKARAPARR